VVYLGREAYPDTYLQFLQEKQIQFARFPLDGNKEPFSAMDEQIFEEALKFICDSRNSPLLIHCHTGVHRTGCVIGIIRRMCGWSLTSIYEEYARMAGTTQPIRSLDRLMIEMYDIQRLRNMLNADFIPSWLQ
jgi:tyrosine-protein phosphatase SIW14